MSFSSRCSGRSRVNSQSYAPSEEEIRRWNFHQEIEKTHRADSESRRFNYLIMNERTLAMRKYELQAIFDRVDMQELGRKKEVLGSVTDRALDITNRPPPGLKRGAGPSKGSLIMLETENMKRELLPRLQNVSGPRQIEPANPGLKLRVIQSLRIHERIGRHLEVGVCDEVVGQDEQDDDEEIIFPLLRTSKSKNWKKLALLEPGGDKLDEEPEGGSSLSGYAMV